MSILATAALPLGEVVFVRDKEIELKRALMRTRQAIDKFYADNGHYPVDFEELRWYWKTNRPYLRQCPPINPLANSHDAWILVLKSNVDPNEKLSEYESEIAYREKRVHPRYLLYGIFDIKVPNPNRSSSEVDLAKYPASIAERRGYKFIDPATGTVWYGPYYKGAMEIYKQALDGSYYHEW